MTISSENRKAGPYTGNGTTTEFSFTFRVFSEEEVTVILTDAAGIESTLTLNSDYAVDLNEDQADSPGGTIIYPHPDAIIPVPPNLPSTKKLTLIGDIDFTQELDITNGGAFYPEAIESAFDKLTMQTQQLKEKVDRAVTVNVSSNILPGQYFELIEGYTEDAEGYASSASSSASAAASSASNAASSAGLINANLTNINKVAAIDDEIVTVANNDEDVDLVATNMSSIQTLAGDLGGGGFSSDLGSITDPASNTNVGSSAIVAVAGSIAEVEIVAENIDDVIAAASAADAANASASAAATSATNAANSATAASTSATNAAASASSASGSASTATTRASEAATSATNAANSASAASTSETNAAASAVSAGSDASSALASAGTATTKAGEASSSASAAATSATNAANSATSASGSATTASTKADEALASAGNAAASAADADVSEANAQAYELSANDWATKTSGPVAGGEYSAKYHAQAAASSASDANDSETAALSAASSAASAQAAAEAARDATLIAYDSFDDRYLGTKTSDPALDNDGNALLAGALYYYQDVGTPSNSLMKIYNGSAWVAAYVSGAGFLAAASNLADLTNAGTARSNLGLGSAAVENTSAFATAAQGAKADTAHGWGNHASAGYLTTYAETDPIFVASPAYGITSLKIGNWDTAFGWGNHASAGYLTAVPDDSVTAAKLAPSLDLGSI